MRHAAAVRSRANPWADIYARLARDRNDELAWWTLEREVRPWARAVFATRGWHAINEVSFATCARVVLAFERARGPETFGGFVYGCFLNERRRQLQAHDPRLIRLEGVDVAVPADDPRPSPAELEQLRDALSHLPERERRAVILRYFEERPAAAIAAELGITEGNARQIVHKGLTRLRRSLRGAPATGSCGCAACPGGARRSAAGPVGSAPGPRRSRATC